MKTKKIFINLGLITLLGGLPAGASMLDYLAPVDPANLSRQKGEGSVVIPTKKAQLTQNDVHNHYTIAMQRFMQCNVKSAYMDFKVLIKSIVPNDYAYLMMADEMAEIGLFNLSEEALSKTTDKDISFVQAEDIKKFYFPKNMLNTEDEIYLAEIYSNIIYNAQSKEASSELIKNTALLEKSDYANYLAALGLLKVGDLENSEKYINTAIKINPQNLNYQKLKIEILLQGDKPQNALKYLTALKGSKLYTEEYINKINTLEQYTLYKTEKNETLKKYHLGYYYFYKKDYPKAVRTLQTAVSSKKNLNREVYALIAEVYFAQKEYEKAENFADKSLKLGGNNPKALVVMGKIKYHNKEYKEALKHFKNADSKLNTEASALLAMTYSALGDNKTAKQINSKILKEHSDCALAYYNMALQDKEREYEYMKKAVAINLKFIDGWIGLTRNALDKSNFDKATKYLAIVKYIDENDFRYYYYQGLMYKAKGLNQDAKYYFQKSLTINPDNDLAKKELEI